MSPLNISLTELITRLDEDLPDADPLTRITEAQLRAQTLTDLGDQLVGHYVGQAKQDGASWTEVGEAIGVTKQAAQQRHAPKAFERFTQLNRHSIVLAQEAARTHKHDLIGTEHLLLGLLGEPHGLAHAVLTAPPHSEQTVRNAVQDALPPTGTKSLRGHIAFHPDSKNAIEQASRAANDLGHPWVGTEHTLLGLVRTDDSTAARILHDLGFTRDGLHEAVKAEIAKRKPSSPPAEA